VRREVVTARRLEDEQCAPAEPDVIVRNLELQESHTSLLQLAIGKLAHHATRFLDLFATFELEQLEMMIDEGVDRGNLTHVKFETDLC